MTGGEREWRSWRGVGGRGARDRWRMLGTLTPHLTSPLEGGRDELGKGVGVEVSGSCLRRNDGGGRGKSDGRGAGMVELVRRGRSGARDRWRMLGTPTPHLTSPLEGGRDELGERVGVEVGGSCLRRNDGGGRRNDGGGVVMTEAGGVRVTEGEREWWSWCGVGDRGARDRWRMLGTLTPHLTSPLEGGRDELGEGVGVEVGGSCLRRNDGGGRRCDGGGV